MRLCHLMGAMGASHGGFPPKMQERDCLIAVDGGLAQILDWGMTPDHSIGDFDSFGYTPQIENVEVLPVRKDETDMEHAVKFAMTLGFRFFLIQGALGGRLDHSYANIQLLQQMVQEGCHGILVGEGQSVLVIWEESVEFPPEMEGICSVFALNSGAEGVTIQGLSYELVDASLSASVPMGVSNEFLEGVSGKISVKKGGLLLIWEGIQKEEFYVGVLDSISKCGGKA